jgi:hypothetical protein
MSNSADQPRLQLNGRAMELFQSGDLADCVIAVGQQDDDGQEKVWF